MILHLEKVSSFIQVWRFKDDLFRIWNDTYEKSPWFYAFLNFPEGTREETLRGEDVVKRKVETHDVKLSIRTVVYVTLIKIDPYVHILGARPGLDERRGFWVTHIYIHSTFVPLLQITSKSTSHVEDMLSFASDTLYELSLRLVVILTNLFHIS